MSTPLVVNHGVAAESKKAMQGMKEHHKIIDKLEEEQAVKDRLKANDPDTAASCTDQSTESTKEPNLPPSE
jgi:hypothetical protein